MKPEAWWWWRWWWWLPSSSSMSGLLLAGDVSAALRSSSPAPVQSPALCPCPCPCEPWFCCWKLKGHVCKQTEVTRVHLVMLFVEEAAVAVTVYHFLRNERWIEETARHYLLKHKELYKESNGWCELCRQFDGQRNTNIWAHFIYL